MTAQWDDPNDIIMIHKRDLASAKIAIGRSLLSTCALINDWAGRQSHTRAYALSAYLAHISVRHITLQRVVSPGHPQSHANLFDEWWDYGSMWSQLYWLCGAGGASPLRDHLCETVSLLLYGGQRWHSTLSSDNWKPVCPSSDVLVTVASRRNIHHRPALLWRFVILAPDTNCILTYLLRGRMS